MGTMDTMAAAVFDGKLNYVEDYSVPPVKPGWAKIQVKIAGICKTDMEILKGYMGFKGVLGHEFVGIVMECDDPSWIGKRVVGEINAACGHCDWCRRDLGRHCPNRSTLGILNLDGCMAEYCTLPIVNLLALPEKLSDERAVLVEPLSAACEILEQMRPAGNERAVILGDGRLGALCAWVLATVLPVVTVVGHHPEKLENLRWRNIRTVLHEKDVAPGADIVVEATGSGAGIVTAMALCRPRGTIVLKSTVAVSGDVNLAPIVINEQTVLGSRCGRFADGLKIMCEYPDMPLDRLITARYPLARVEEAFARATQSDALKVLLDIHP
ncbi:MAG TPA: alcohol dehydrogenase catalytic domain-containing protein [Smithellaceae bacterium]|jgi:alcohol dehydrogenase|nr:alcohol dehydrogenase catalytic domain-containing protein [Smithellaceae bacterium]